MNKFFKVVQLKPVELFLDEILDGLYVMVRGLFDILDILRMELRKILVDPPNVVDHMNRKIFKLRKCTGKGDEVFNFNLLAILALCLGLTI